MQNLAKYRMAVIAVVAALAAPFSLDAAAQDWPSKPVKFIVPFAAGGVTDVVVRAIAPKLGDALGQPIVVENRGGAGGTLGTSLAAQAAPDGYTFVTPAASHATTPGLYSKLPFDPVGDFIAVTQFVTVPYILVVNPEFPVANVSDFIALARAKPGTLTYGSAGSGSSNHLAGALFGMMANIDIVHSPYKGSAPALTDLMGGHIAFMFDPLNTSVPHLRTGKLKALGVGTAKRASAVPDVPTIAESGLEGFEAATWIGLLAPAGTPSAIVDRMNREVLKVLQLPEVRERLSAQGAEPVGSSPAEFDAFMKSEISKWGDVIRKAKVPMVQ